MSRPVWVKTWSDTPKSGFLTTWLTVYMYHRLVEVPEIETRINEPSMTQPVWSESSLSSWRSIGSLATHSAHNEDSDQTGWMPRLICVFAGRTPFCWFSHAVAQIHVIYPWKWHWQTVWTEIRRRSKWRLIRVYNVCIQEFLSKIK